jgi:hypothetical protein
VIEEVRVFRWCFSLFFSLFLRLSVYFSVHTILVLLIGSCKLGDSITLISESDNR